MHWGRGILIWGVVMGLAAGTPALLIFLLPGLGDGFFGTVAILLALTVVPMSVVIASVGAILLLVSAVRRARP